MKLINLISRVFELARTKSETIIFIYIYFLGDKDESKELLEKKEGDAEVGEPKEEEEPAEDKSEKVVEEPQPASKGNVFLDSLRSVASHVPSIFKGIKRKLNHNMFFQCLLVSYGRSIFKNP